MGNFTGKLNANEIFGALYNMIISQEVFADNIKGSDLVDQARVDGSLYGDQKLFYSTDALASAEWGNDAEAVNLLAINRPEDPKCQAITLDVFRQISLTLDNYLSKRAWSDEGSFSAFNSVMQGWLKDTKKVYDGTLYNCYIGTTETAIGSQTKIVSATVAADAKQLAAAIADTITEMTDYNRDYNDYGQLKRCSEGDLKIIFNSKYVNRIMNVDLPVIFDNAGLKGTFSKECLPARYFGTVNVPKKTADAKTRSLIEQTINNVHYFAGDKIKVGDEAPAGTSYQEDDKIIAKIMIKLPPYMSAFEVGTSFFNPKSLTENHYLTFGHNTIEYLKAYPFVTIKSA